jgi:hypothetical protein
MIKPYCVLYQATNEILEEKYSLKIFLVND